MFQIGLVETDDLVGFFFVGIDIEEHNGGTEHHFAPGVESGDIDHLGV